jgi:lysozyme
MEIPSNAIELIKRWEGCHKLGNDGRYRPYLCPAGIWTIGYGSTRHVDGSRVTSSSPALSREECELLLLRDTYGAVQSTLLTSPTLINYPKALGAIVSFVYNLGAPKYKASTLRRKIDAGDWIAAEKEIKKWVWGGGKRLPGLVLRREDESQYLRATEA